MSKMLGLICAEGFNLSHLFWYSKCTFKLHDWAKFSILFNQNLLSQTSIQNIQLPCKKKLEEDSLC